MSTLLERRQVVIGGFVRVIRIKPAIIKGRHLYAIQVLQMRGAASLLDRDEYMDRALNNKILASPNATAYILPEILDSITVANHA